MIQEDKSTTLATNNDQYLFAPVILDDQGGQQISVRTDGKSPTLRAEMHGHPPYIVSAGFCPEVSEKARGVGYEDEMCPTLRAGTIPAAAICEAYVVENHPADSRVRIDDSGKCQTLTSRMGTGGGNVPLVLCLQGNTVDRSVGQNGAGVNENICFTLNATDRHAVSYGVDCRNMAEYPELYPTLQAKPNGGQSLNFSGAVRVLYIVRRLTPTECARLQGFADHWGHPEHKDSMTSEEYRFWLSVRNTHARINGKPMKDYTPAQILTWYNKLHTDSAEYKMWGNGIALPPALYCLQGIADALAQEDDWMD